eukprot:PhM_4_TR13920/c0_g1_i1/m.70621
MFFMRLSWLSRFTEGRRDMLGVRPPCAGFSPIERRTFTFFVKGGSVSTSHVRHKFVYAAFVVNSTVLPIDSNTFRTISGVATVSTNTTALWFDSAHSAARSSIQASWNKSSGRSSRETPKSVKENHFHPFGGLFGSGQTGYTRCCVDVLLLIEPGRDITFAVGKRTSTTPPLPSLVWNSRSWCDCSPRSTMSWRRRLAFPRQSSTCRRNCTYSCSRPRRRIAVKKWLMWSSSMCIASPSLSVRISKSVPWASTLWARNSAMNLIAGVRSRACAGLFSMMRRRSWKEMRHASRTFSSTIERVRPFGGDSWSIDSSRSNGALIAASMYMCMLRVTIVSFRSAKVEDKIGFDGSIGSGWVESKNLHARLMASM